MIVIHAKSVTCKLHDIVYFTLVNVQVVLSEKNQIRISCKYAHIHSMSLSTKFYEILLSAFRGELTKYLSSICIFNQILKFKRGVTLRKNTKSCKYANLLHNPFITTQFHDILLSGFRGVASFSFILKLTRFLRSKGA